MLLDALRRDLLFAKNQISLVSRILENKDENTFVLCLDMDVVTILIVLQIYILQDAMLSEF